MAQALTSNRRIIKNTLLLYTRMLVLMCISFFTSRIVLKALGVEDYGVYMVVGGMVSMLAFLNNSMTLGTNRFLAYAIGLDDEQRLRVTFGTAVFIHFLLALGIIVLAETVGLWYFYRYLNIPSQTMGQAMWVYQLSVITCAVSICNVPYMGMVTAHEDMKAFAYISLGEGIAKLTVAYVITIPSLSNIKCYALLLWGVAMLTALFWAIYVRRSFKVTRQRLLFDKKMFKEMFGFVSWQTVGSLSWALRNQGSALVLNCFFGPVLNTARSLAVQVNGGLTSLVGNFQMASSPQLVKHYAADNLPEMMKLLHRSSKVSFILLFVFAFPVLWQVEPVVGFWLGELPPFAVTFIRLAIVALLVDSLSGTLQQTALATGRIRLYTLSVTVVMLSYILFVYIFFKFGYSAVTMLYIEMCIYFAVFLVRLRVCRHLYGLSVKSFLANVTLREILLVITATVLVGSFYFFTGFSAGLLVNLSAGFVLTAACCWFVGLNAQERIWSMNLIKSKFTRNS